MAERRRRESHIMDMKLIILVIFFFTTSQLAKSTETDLWVNPTLVTNDAGAVCLTGKPASYYYSPGFGNGASNWLVYLSGGGWCANFTDCILYANILNLTRDPTPLKFEYILSNNKDQNADFFNWNKVVLTYCDGGSFTGDTEKAYNGTKLYFKGGRIFDTVMQELLHKGMKLAQNALLIGTSAGGVSTALHCDGFRDLLPCAGRVKCLSDAGYFFPSRRFKDEGDRFIPTFKGLITLHESTKWLPASCTSRLSPHLCFFHQNVVQDIKTPMFFLTSAFDSFQIFWTFKRDGSITDCVKEKNCSRKIIKILQDLRLELLSVLPKQSNTSSTGILVTSPVTHGQARDTFWNSDMVKNESNETISIAYLRAASNMIK